MLKDIYEPLTEYINVFRERFKKVAEETFAELAAEAQVDIEANRETCRQLYKSQADHNVQNQLKTANLPAALFNGTFSCRDNAGLKS